MIPGFGRGMNPHKMKRMMKQMGINIQELEDVEERAKYISDRW
jgi:nascent polypeptide-associated complex subunit alpha